MAMFPDEPKNEDRTYVNARGDETIYVIAEDGIVKVTVEAFDMLLRRLGFHEKDEQP